MLKGLLQEVEEASLLATKARASAAYDFLRGLLMDAAADGEFSCTVGPLTDPWWHDVVNVSLVQGVSGVFFFCPPLPLRIEGKKLTRSC